MESSDKSKSDFFGDVQEQDQLEVNEDDRFKKQNSYTYWV